MGLNSFFNTVFSASVITALAALGTYIYQKKRGKEAIPSKWEQVGKLTKIRLYPLKSGHRLEVDRAEVTEFGLKQTEEDERIYQLRDRFEILKPNYREFSRTFGNFVEILWFMRNGTMNTELPEPILKWYSSMCPSMTRTI